MMKKTSWSFYWRVVWPHAHNHQLHSRQVLRLRHPLRPHRRLLHRSRRGQRPRRRSHPDDGMSTGCQIGPKAVQAALEYAKSFAELAPPMLGVLASAGKRWVRGARA